MKRLGPFYTRLLSPEMLRDGPSYHSRQDCHFLAGRRIMERDEVIDADRNTWIAIQIDRPDGPFRPGDRGSRRWYATTPCGHCGSSELEAVLARSGPWRERGSCFDTQHPGFFNVSSPGVTLTEEALDALGMCDDCDVLSECREFGRALHREVGPLECILGGETDSDRERAMREDRRR